MVLRELSKGRRTENEISKDIQVQSLRAQLNQEDSIISQLQGFGPSYRPLISAKAAREDMQRRLDDAIAERRAQVTATIIEGLRQNKEQTDSQMKAIAEKVDSAKQDLGEMTNSLNQYLIAKDDEQTMRDMLKQVSDQLELITGPGNSDETAIQWALSEEKMLEWAGR